MNYIEFFKSKTNCPSCGKNLIPIFNFYSFADLTGIRVRGTIRYGYDFYTDKLYLIDGEGSYKELRHMQYLQHLVNTVPAVISMNLDNKFPILHPELTCLTVSLHCYSKHKWMNKCGKTGYKNYMLESNIVTNNDLCMELVWWKEFIYYDYKNIIVTNNHTYNKTTISIDGQSEDIPFIPIEAWPKQEELDMLKIRLNVISLLK